MMIRQVLIKKKNRINSEVNVRPGLILMKLLTLIDKGIYSCIKNYNEIPMT